MAGRCFDWQPPLPLIWDFIDAFGHFNDNTSLFAASQAGAAPPPPKLFSASCKLAFWDSCVFFCARLEGFFWAPKSLWKLFPRSLSRKALSFEKKYLLSEACRVEFLRNVARFDKKSFSLCNYSTTCLGGSFQSVCCSLKNFHKKTFQVLSISSFDWNWSHAKSQPFLSLLFVCRYSYFTHYRNLNSQRV